MKNTHLLAIAFFFFAALLYINGTDSMGQCKAKGHSHEYCSGELLK